MQSSQGPWVIAIKRIGTTILGLLPAREAIVFDEAAFTVTDEPDTPTKASDGAEVRGRLRVGLQTLAGLVASVTGAAPIVSSGGATPVISITPATTSAAGSLSAADKTKLDSIADGAAVANVVGAAPIVVTGSGTKTVSITNASSITAGAMTTTLYDFLTNILTATTPTTIQPDDAADGGAQSFAARADHTHGIATDTPVDIGASNAEGAATSFARSDHVHAHAWQIEVGANTIQLSGTSYLAPGYNPGAAPANALDMAVIKPFKIDSLALRARLAGSSGQTMTAKIRKNGAAVAGAELGTTSDETAASNTFSPVSFAAGDRWGIEVTLSSGIATSPTDAFWSIGCTP